MPRDDSQYPNGYTHPQNFNTLGRPPRNMRLDDPEARAILQSPDLMRRLVELSAHHPEVAVEMATDLRQFERALNGDRQRVGEYNGDSRFPTEPLPFAPRETHRPDREPGTRDYNVMRQAVERLAATEVGEALSARMAEPTTWERADPNYGRTSEAERTPSLRDSLRAAVDHHEE